MRNLKELVGKGVKSFILLLTFFSFGAGAAPLPNGDTQVTSIEDFKLKMGVQYRILWNQSNIPLSGVTTASDTRNYDFFRQRMRLNIDIQPIDEVGGFLQLEYRGGWGGSSPASSDPRGHGLTLNNFNRLQARGVRYGYIYYTPTENTCLAVGIIPISDRLGDVLFSADWDFNVGGISYNSTIGRTKYRAAYVRVIDGVASSNKEVIGENADLFIADIDLPETSLARVGLHIYYLTAPRDVALEAGLPGKASLGWYAMSGSFKFEPVTLNTFICLNSGTLGNENNTGGAFKSEVVIPLGSPTLKVMGVFATGDKGGKSSKNQFRTIQGIFGTEGFWAYTHIFTANPPSDVNDFGVGIDNGGRGLISIQAKCDTPLIGKLNGELFSGWLRASTENTTGNNEMGSEIGGVITYKMAKYLDLQFGTAFAFLKDFYKSNGKDPDTIHEHFSRFQFQF